MSPQPQTYDTIIIGGGQAGLAAGYYLRQQFPGALPPFVIFDASQRIGDSWRQRWDSLRLFTPVRSTSLPGMPYPAPMDTFPTKDEMADYLEAYAARFDLPVQSGVRVERLEAAGDGRYAVTANGQRYTADQVIIASGAYQSPKTPDFADQLDPAIQQMHSSQYRRPGQLPDGLALVVGAGNSGAEIALDVAHTHPVILAGRSTGTPYFPPESRAALLLNPILIAIVSRLLSVDTSAGRRLRAHLRLHGQPVVRVMPAALQAAGVERVLDRVTGVQDGKPVLSDGRVVQAASVIWCTGFRRDFSLIELPIFDEQGYPRETRGVVQDAPGLYFVGLVFQSSAFSTLIGGVGSDAAYIAQQIAARRASRVS